MEIEVKQKVNVPMLPWCGSCYRREVDKRGNCFCTLWNHFLFMHNGKFLKCRECYSALYDALESEEP